VGAVVVSDPDDWPYHHGRHYYAYPRYRYLTAARRTAVTTRTAPTITAAIGATDLPAAGHRLGSSAAKDSNLRPTDTRWFGAQTRAEIHPRGQAGRWLPDDARRGTGVLVLYIPGPVPPTTEAAGAARSGGYGFRKANIRAGSG